MESEIAGTGWTAHEDEDEDGMGTGSGNGNINKQRIFRAHIDQLRSAVQCSVVY